MSHYNQNSKENMALADISCAGLIAISLIILQVFISSSSLDSAEFTSVLAFAASIPLLAGRLIQNFIKRLPEQQEYSMGVSGFYGIGATGVMVGIDAAFWHVSWIAGVLFLVSTFIAFIVCAVTIIKDNMGH